MLEHGADPNAFVEHACKTREHVHWSHTALHAAARKGYAIQGCWEALFGTDLGSCQVPVSDRPARGLKPPNFLRPKPDLLPAQAGSTTASLQPWYGHPEKTWFGG
jgi:hypothetical protein